MTESGARTSSEPDGAALPSPPTDRELAILRRVLGAATVPGVEQLVDQLRMLQVAPVSDPTCRIYLVHPDAPRAEFAREDRRTLPTRFPVRTPTGRIAGHVAVWVQQGHLCALQYVTHGPSATMGLPPAEQVELPAAEVSIAISARGARQALSGVQGIGAEPVRTVEQPVAPQPAAAPTASTPVATRPWLRRIVAALVASSVVAIAATAFLTAYAQGADVDAARSAGAAAGAELGAEHGEVAGRFAGDVEGRVAGRNATYPAAYVAARDRTQAQLRQAALDRRSAQRQRDQDAAAAAAAAAPPAYVAPAADNTTCPGYRDARGFWICS